MSLKKLTKKQANAFSRVVKAMEAAHKLGMSFYAKQGELTAVNHQTGIYEHDNDLYNSRHCEGTNTIERFSATVLADSGADDYPHYLNDKDDPYKGGFQETPETYMPKQFKYR